MALLQWCHCDGIITIMTWLQQQKHLYDGIVVKVLSSRHGHDDMMSQWCHHDGIVTIMMWLQQQKYLYDSIVVKASLSWHHHDGVIMMVSTPS